MKAPFGGEYRRPTFFPGGSRFGESLAVSCRGLVVFSGCVMPRSKIPQFSESRVEKLPRVRERIFFSAKRFGTPRSGSRVCLLYVVTSSFLASLLDRTLGGFGVALGGIWLHFGAWRRPKGTKNQSSFMSAFWNCKKYDAPTF